MITRTILHNRPLINTQPITQLAPISKENALCDITTNNLPENNSWQTGLSRFVNSVNSTAIIPFAMSPFWDGFFQSAVEFLFPIGLYLSFQFLGRKLWRSIQAGGKKLEDGNVIAELNCKIESEIAHGANGIIYLATQPIGNSYRNVAVKLLGAPENLDDFKREVTILSKLQHTGLVPSLYSDVIELPPVSRKRRYAFIMEFVHGATLDKWVKDINNYKNPDWVFMSLGIFHKIAKTIQLAHEEDIIHGDIKPNNVMISKLSIKNNDDADVKVIDWGSARGINEIRDSNATEAILWLESGTFIDNRVSLATDIYSLGLMLYYILSGGKDPYNLKRSGVKPRDIIDYIKNIRPNDYVPLSTYLFINDEKYFNEFVSELDKIIRMALGIGSNFAYLSAIEIRKAVDNAYEQYYNGSKGNNENGDV